MIYTNEANVGKDNIFFSSGLNPWKITAMKLNFSYTSTKMKNSVLF